MVLVREPVAAVGPAVRGGLDLQMPGPDGPWGDGLLAAVRSGEVPVELLDDKVLRLLRLARRVGALAPHRERVVQDAPEPRTRRSKGAR